MFHHLVKVFVDNLFVFQLFYKDGGTNIIFYQRTLGVVMNFSKFTVAGELNFRPGKPTRLRRQTMEDSEQMDARAGSSIAETLATSTVSIFCDQTLSANVHWFPRFFQSPLHRAMLSTLI